MSRAVIAPDVDYPLSMSREVGTRTDTCPRSHLGSTAVISTRGGFFPFKPSYPRSQSLTSLIPTNSLVRSAARHVAA